MCGIFGIYGHKDAARLTYLGFTRFSIVEKKARGLLRITGRKLVVIKAWDSLAMYLAKRV